ncbi:1,4-beta-D-glucan cellobiohydrolase CEL6B, partial [Lachnellula arida]
MHVKALPTVLSAANTISALPSTSLPRAEDARDVNPFLSKNYFANAYYAGELNQTVAAFLAKNDSLNAARTRTVQGTGTFVWITSVAGLSNTQSTIDAARAERQRTRKQQIVELVLYDLPDRDCSGGQSGGDFSSANDGLNLYKTFVDPYAAALKAARDLTFAVILEPAATEFAKVVHLAQNLTLGGAGAQIRGFSTDVSNFNPYIADPRANYTQYSNAYDELHYAEVLAPHLANNSLPAHFIIDQGRSGLQNTRTTWGEWCIVEAGFGIPPTADTNSTLVDSIVWAKPGGESNGACGPDVDGGSAPGAGLWWEAYVEELVRNADPPLAASYTAL